MDIAALYRISYGLYIAGVECQGNKNACVINTAVQVTLTPVGVAITLLKSNLTTSMIQEKGSLAVSVISIDTKLKTIQHFGGQSGRDIEKFASVKYETDKNDNPYIKDTMIAYMSLEVTQTIDLDTHFMFICTVTEAENLGSQKPMTYMDYRNFVAQSGKKSAMAPAVAFEKQYVCSVCHYVYDGDSPFEELPEDYVCPICNQPKSVFDAI